MADNPILWARDYADRSWARLWQRITGVCICLMFLLVICLFSDRRQPMSLPMIWRHRAAGRCVFNFLIAGIISGGIRPTAIAQEKESDTWTLLLAAPVSGSTIVWGKALGTARRLLWPMVLVAAHFLLFACCQVITFGAAFAAIWIMITFNSIWIATGVYFSLRFNKTTFAVIANLMLAIAAYLFVFAAFGAASNADYASDPRYSTIDPRVLGKSASNLFPFGRPYRDGCSLGAGFQSVFHGVRQRGAAWDIS